MKIRNKLLLSNLFFSLFITTILSAQVKVDVNSSVGIKTEPFSWAPTNYYPELSLLGRFDMRYPGLYLVNFLIGNQVGNSSMTGDFNFLFGQFNGESLTNGRLNTLIGKWTGRSVTSGSGNVCLGGGSGSNLTTGWENTFLGGTSGGNFNTGNFNVAIGKKAGTSDTGTTICTGTNNVLIGTDVGESISGNASGNVGIGTFALIGLNAGIDNLALGKQALGHVQNGQSNVAIGAYSGDYTIGSQNVYIGNHAGEGDANNPSNESNRLYIHSSTVPTSNPLVYGEFLTPLLRINGKTEIIGNLEVNNNVDIVGTLTASVKNFKIDHPLNPDEKDLVFASIEAPEMLNMFRGNVTTDKDGYAKVVLPDYFTVSNTNLSYHLTCIGVFAQAMVSQKAKDNTFIIQTDQPYVEVSWQVLAQRDDEWARLNPLIVEQEKEK